MIVIDVEKTGENIERMMKEKGLTPSKLAADIGVSLNALTSWMRGDVLFAVEYLLALSIEFGVPMVDLLSISRDDPA